MEFVKTDRAPAAIGPYSQAVKVNGMVYTSGQIALRPDGTMVEDDVVNRAQQEFDSAATNGIPPPPPPRAI